MQNAIQAADIVTLLPSIKKCKLKAILICHAA